METMRAWFVRGFPVRIIMAAVGRREPVVEIYERDEGGV